MKDLVLVVLFLMSSYVRANSFVPDSFSTDYIKTYVSKTKKVVTQPGTLHYLYPGQLRVESNVTTKTISVINHENYWYFQGALKGSEEPGAVTISKTIPLPMIKLLDSLKDGIENSPYFTKSNSGFDIILKSKPDFLEESNIKELILKDSFKHSIKSLKDVKTLVITEANNTITTYEFKKFKIENFKKDHFVFQIPPNVKVTRE